MEPDVVAVGGVGEVEVGVVGWTTASIVGVWAVSTSDVYRIKVVVVVQRVLVAVVGVEERVCQSQIEENNQSRPPWETLAGDVTWVNHRVLPANHDDADDRHMHRSTFYPKGYYSIPRPAPILPQ